MKLKCLTYDCHLKKNARKLQYTDQQGVKTKIEVTYQTRETVFHRDVQTTRRELKIRRAEEVFFDKIRAVTFG